MLKHIFKLILKSKINLTKFSISSYTLMVQLHKRKTSLKIRTSTGVFS